MTQDKIAKSTENEEHTSGKVIKIRVKLGNLLKPPK